MNLVPLAVIRQAPKTVLLGCMTVIPASRLPWRACKDGVTRHATLTITTDDDDRNSKSNYNYNF